MISIKSFNEIGETTLLQLFRDQVRSLNKDHFLNTLGIRFNYEESDDSDRVGYTTTWEFPDYQALRVFIEQVIMAAVPRSLCHYSGDDDYYDYHGALVDETVSFFASLTEAIPPQELKRIISRTDLDNYNAEKLLDSIQMAIRIINAILRANTEIPSENDEGRFFIDIPGVDPHFIPDYLL